MRRRPARGARQEERRDERLTANAREAAAIVAEVFATATAAQWSTRLRDFRGQWALVQDTGDLAADPQVQANHYIIGARTASGTPFSLVATPVQFDGESAATRASAGIQRAR